MRRAHLQHAARVALGLAAQVLLHFGVPQLGQVRNLDAALHQRLRSCMAPGEVGVLVQRGPRVRLVGGVVNYAAGQQAMPAGAGPSQRLLPGLLHSCEAARCRVLELALKLPWPLLRYRCKAAAAPLAFSSS